MLTRLFLLQDAATLKQCFDLLCQKRMKSTLRLVKRFLHRVRLSLFFATFTMETSTCLQRIHCTLLAYCFNALLLFSRYLFAAPQFYGFTNNQLQVFCKLNLEVNVSPRNVVEILEAADRIEAHDMKRHALSIIVQHFPQVARTSNIRNLPKELLLDVLDALADHMSISVAVVDRQVTV
eukprot:m.15171 g.15171  ORF g.15171 m.15171 type:complete len:179 (+) comp26227_c0_seq2:1853-2389(+)